MPSELMGKRIVLIGAAGLLGSALAREISKAGARLVLADISLENVEALARAIEKETGILPLVSHVSIVNRDSIDSMIKFTHGALGGIDGLVNAAYPRNKAYGRKFEDVEYSDFCENVNLHLGGYFLVSQRILEYYSANGGGSLLNISSIYGLVAPRFEIYDDTSMTMPIEYAAIKSAIIHLSAYFAKYYAGKNIRANAISIGGLRDKQPESFLQKYRGFCLNKGMLDPLDISGTVISLLSDATKYINGQNIILDDGFTL